MTSPGQWPGRASRLVRGFVLAIYAAALRQLALLAPRALSAAIWIAAFFAYAAAFRDWPQLVYALLCLAAGRFVATFIHEAGHALAALALDWHVLLFVVRPIGLQIPNRNPALVPAAFKPDAAGWVTAVPRTPDADTKRSWSIIVASGSGASFAVGLLLILGWATFLRPLDGQALFVSQLGLGLGLQSLRSAIFALLPAADGGAPTDGDQLRQLRGPEARYELNRPIIWLGALLSNKVRLRDLPDWLLAEADSQPSPSDEIVKYLATVHAARLLDAAPVDVGRARRLIDDYRARYGADPWLAACDAWLAAIWEGDSDRAQAAIDEAPFCPEVPQLSLAAKAAVAASRGESALARILLEDMEQAVKRDSPFRDLTYRDISRQVEAALA